MFINHRIEKKNIKVLDIKTKYSYILRTIAGAIVNDGNILKHLDNQYREETWGLYLHGVACTLFPIAQSLKSNRTITIGVIVPEIK